MIRTIAAAAGLAVAASGASAAFVGGGTYSFGATLSDGTNVLVNRMFLAYDGEGGANSPTDGAVNIFSASFSSNNGEQLLQVGIPDGFGGTNDIDHAGQRPAGVLGSGSDIEVESFVSIGNLAASPTSQLDPSFGWTNTGVVAGAGWLTGNPSAEEHFAAAPGSGPITAVASSVVPAGLPSGFLFQFIGQFTIIVGAEGASADPSFTGVGNGFIASNSFSGSLGLTSLGEGAAFTDVLIQRIPTPGALALFGVAGLTAVRRRRS